MFRMDPFRLWILLLVCTTQAELICHQKEELDCNQDGCMCADYIKTASCYRDVKIQCFNGECTAEGCKCLPCWTGPECNIPDAGEPPQFLQQKYTFEADALRSGKLGSVKAEDADLESCDDKRLHHCPCARIKYAIQSGNASKQFSIDDDSGEISLKQDGIAGYREVDIVISAENAVTENETKATVQVTVVFTDSYGFPDIDAYSKFPPEVTEEDDGVKHIPHHRSKRSASAVPTNMTFTLEKVGSSVNVTSVRVADQLQLQLTIWVPVMTTDLRIELYTPHNGTAVMALCSPTVTRVGSNFNFNASAIVPVLDASGNDFKYDHAVIDFGVVSNSGSDTNTKAASEIVLDFDVLMLDLENGTSYRVTAGGDFEEGRQIWVGAAIFIGSNDTLTPTGSNPSFSLDGPSEVMKGETGVWTLTMILHEASQHVVVTVSSTCSVSICRINVASTGGSYGCFPLDGPQTEYPSGDTDSARLNLGQVVNSGYWTGNATDEDNTINVDIAARLPNTSDVTAGQSCSIQVGVTVDNAAIWTGPAAFTARELMITNKSELSVALTTLKDTAMVHGVAVFQLNLTVPVNATVCLIAELALPFNGTALMTVCDLKFSHVGFNLPCVRNVTKEYMSQKSDGLLDYVKVDFGIVKNTGQRNEMYDNTISIEISVLILDHPIFTGGDKRTWVTGAVFYGANQIWAGSNYIDVVTNPDRKQPDMNLIRIMNRKDNPYVYRGGQSAFYLDILVPPDNILPFIRLNLSTPVVEQEPELKICRFTLLHIGKNIPCLENTTKISSSVPSGVENLASAQFPVVTNVGKTVLSKNRNDSIIRFEVVVSVRDDAVQLTNSTVELDATMDYGNITSLTETITWEYLDEESILSWEDIKPSVTFNLASASETIGPGNMAVYDVKITSSPRTIIFANFEVVSYSTPLAVCRLQVRSRGFNFPCLSEAAEPKYYQYNNSYYSLNGSLNLMNIANVGQGKLNSTTEPENQMVVEAVVSIRDDISVSPGSIHTFTLQHFGSNGHQEEFTRTITAATASYTNNPAISVELRNKDGDDTVVLGAASVYQLIISVPPNTRSGYKITFTVNDDTRATICEARVTTAGWNLPCVTDDSFTYKITSQNGNVTFNSVELKTTLVGNMATSGATTDDKNQMMAEVVLMAPTNSSAQVNDTVRLSADVKNSADTTLWNGEKTILVTSQPAQNTSGIGVMCFWKNYSLGQIYQNISETVTWSASFDLSNDSTSNVTVRVSIPSGSNEAYMTVNDLKVTSFGVNIPCTKLESEYVNSSAHGTTQMTSAALMFGYVTNTGLYTRNQWRRKKAEDNQIHIEFKVQMADHKDNTDGVHRTLVVAVDTDGTEACSVNGTAIVRRDNSERPDLMGAMWLNNGTAPAGIKRRQQLQIHFELNHTNQSNAHALNVRGMFFLPPYIVYAGLSDWKFTEPQINPTAGNVIFNFPAFYFTENISFAITVEVDPYSTMSAEVEHAAHIALEVAYKYKNFTGGSLSYSRHAMDMLDVEFNFTANDTARSLGLEDGRIADCQLLASSHMGNFTAQEARLNGNSSWVSAWRGEPFTGKEFLQINLGNLTRITGIKIQAGSSGSFVTSFALAHSMENIRWENYSNSDGTKKVFSISLDGSPQDMKYVSFGDDSIETRYLRVIALTNNNGSPAMSMRLELIGRQKGGDTPMEAICKNNTDPPVYQRGYLFDPEGSLYVCMQTEIGRPALCAMSSDCGYSWNEIDERVSNINFLRKDTDTLYGYGQRHDARMRSYNSGFSWVEITPVEYDTALQDSANIIEVTQVPFVQINGPTAIYDSGSCNVSVIEDGMNFSNSSSTYKITF